jgi:hypothetical protein
MAGRQGFAPIRGTPKAEPKREAEVCCDVTEARRPAMSEAEGRDEWLGGRDSNPDKQSQSLLSYR